MNIAAVGHGTGSARARLTAWVVLGCAIAIAAALMSLATSTTRESRRAIGNGVGRYVDVTTSSDTRMAAAAWVVLAAGAGAWALLLGRSVTRARFAPAVVAASAAVVTGYLWVASPLLAGDGWSDSERYEDIGAVVDSLRTSGMPCDRITEVPATTMFGDRRECSQPNPADINDGHDEVVLGIFANNSARDRWTAETDHDDIYAVIGPQWLATCDFQATCARIQASIGGRNY
jgi:hypothetical protein